MKIDNIANITQNLDEAIALIGNKKNKTNIEVSADIIPEKLLEQCHALCEEGIITDSEPIRTIHHLSCTGGTLFAKCIASMPNVLLMNEVDPLSKLGKGGKKPEFTPRDMISLLLQGDPNIPQDILIGLFVNNLNFIYHEQTKIGRSMVLRDHSHSHFLTGDTVEKRPTLIDILKDHFPIKSIVTVRDPIDSYLSMRRMGWHQHFTPSTFDEYCRRYIIFLDKHYDVDIVEYEAFISKPKKTMKELCKLLSLEYSNVFTNTFGVHEFSGDSGRKSDIIGKRSRDELDEDFAKEIAVSPTYNELRVRLRYLGFE